MPKSTNPTNKDIEDSIQAATQQFEDDIADTNSRLGEVNTTIESTNNRLTAELGVLNTKLDNQQQLQEERFKKELAASNESLKMFIVEALKAHGVTPTTTTAAPSTPAAAATVTAATTISAATVTTATTIPAATVTAATIVPTATVATTQASPTSGISLSSFTQPVSEPIFTQLSTPIHTTSFPSFSRGQQVSIFPTTPLSAPLQFPHHHGTYTPPVMTTSLYTLPPPPHPPPPFYTAGSTSPMFSSSNFNIQHQTNHFHHTPTLTHLHHHLITTHLFAILK
jgi:hypothetical protein